MSDPPHHHINSQCKIGQESDTRLASGIAVDRQTPTVLVPSVRAAAVAGQGYGHASGGAGSLTEGVEVSCGGGKDGGQGGQPQVRRKPDQDRQTHTGRQAGREVAQPRQQPRGCQSLAHEASWWVGVTMASKTDCCELPLGGRKAKEDKCGLSSRHASRGMTHLCTCQGLGPWVRPWMSTLMRTSWWGAVWTHQPAPHTSSSRPSTQRVRGEPSQTDRCRLPNFLLRRTR